MANGAGGDGRRRRRALLLNENANPFWVSVALVGWNQAAALAKVADVHQVTNVRNRENFLKAGLREGEDFTVLETEAQENAAWGAARLLGARGGRGWSTINAMLVFAYRAFERKVWERFGDRLRSGEFDLVHRLTPLTPSIPSWIATRCAEAGVPFVLGPLNGGLPWPRGYTRVRLREREFMGYLRWAYRLVPGYRSTRAHASAILVGSRAMHRQIGRPWRDKTVYLPENGIDPALFDRPAEGPVSLPLRVVFVGRLVPVKCVDILLEAAAPLVRSGQVAIEVIGDGPELPALKAQAEREGLRAGVAFPGWVDHRSLKDRLATAHLFAFPSVRDFGGGAVLEAMASGLPPIVVDFGGPSELVTPRTGFAVPMGPRPSLVAGFRSRLEGLVAEPGGLREMGQRARQRVFRLFTWDAKAAQTLEVYRWVLGERDRPDFGMPFPD